MGRRQAEQRARRRRGPGLFAPERAAGDGEQAACSCRAGCRQACQVVVGHAGRTELVREAEQPREADAGRSCVGLGRPRAREDVRADDGLLDGVERGIRRGEHDGSGRSGDDGDVSRLGVTDPDAAHVRVATAREDGRPGARSRSRTRLRAARRRPPYLRARGAGRARDRPPAQPAGHSPSRRSRGRGRRSSRPRTARTTTAPESRKTSQSWNCSTCRARASCSGSWRASQASLPMPNSGAAQWPVRSYRPGTGQRPARHRAGPRRDDRG